MYNVTAKSNEGITVYNDKGNGWEWLIQPYFGNKSLLHVMCCEGGQVLESLSGLFKSRGDAILHIEKNLSLC